MMKTIFYAVVGIFAIIWQVVKFYANIGKGFVKTKINRNKK